MTTTNNMDFTYTKSVKSLDAVRWYMIKNFDLTDLVKYVDYTTDPNDPTGNTIDSITVHTRVPVPENRIAELNTVVANYTDPVYYFPGLDHVETYPIYTAKYGGVSDFPVYSWIIPYRKFALGSGKNNLPTVINEIKLLFQIHTDNITLFSGVTSYTFNVELFNVTDNTSIVTEIVDISSVINDWKTETSNGGTGPAFEFKTMQFTDMWNKNPDYDCIMKINISSANQDIQLSLATIQYMCYPEPVYV
jgi:hypothetical protein